MSGVIVSGLVTGSLYALASLAVVIVYKSCRIANFATGGTASLAVYIAYSVSNSNPPYWVLIAVALVCGGVFGAATDFIVRLLGDADHLAYIIGTFAVFLVTQGVILWHWGASNETLGAAWSVGAGLHIGGTLLSYNDILIIGIALIATAGLHFVVQHTRFGLSVRMASSGPLTSRLMGVNGGKVRLITWVIGGSLGGLAALLVTPQITLSDSGFTSFMMIAFVALVIGGFTSIPGAAAGGLILGILLNLLSYWLSPSLTNTYMFVIVAAVLFLRPHGILGVRDAVVPEPMLRTGRFRGIASRLTRPRRAASPSALGTPRPNPTVMTRRWLPAGTALASAALLITLPLFVPNTLFNLLPQWMTMYLAVLGLNLLAGFSGQLSVGQSGFMAIGAYTGAILVTHLGVPALVTIPTALVTGLLAGFVVGLPAVRLGPLFLVLFTLVLSFAVPELITYLGVTGGNAGLALAFPSWLFSIRNQYWLDLGVAVLCTGIVYTLTRVEFGRRWTAVKDSAAGAQSVGLNITVVRLSAFMAAGALASLSGVLSAIDTGFVSPSDYSPFLSITLLVAVVIGGTGSIFGSAIGAAVLIAATAYAPDINVPADFVLGVVLLIVLVISPAGAADGIKRVAYALLQWLGHLLPQRAAHMPLAVVPADRAELATHRLAATEANTEESDLATVTELVPDVGSVPLLDIRDITAGYGAAVALSGVSITLTEGSATALVGSNGAGKTTILRVISGLVRPSRGNVDFGGLDVIGTSPHVLARAGIAHVPEGRGIFPDLTVRENLLASSFSRKPDGDADLGQAIDVFPKLGSLLTRTAGSLSGGEQQMVAVARALLTRPRLLLLDEPTLGLAPAVAKSLMESLSGIRKMGVAVLLVEQNARAALEFADTAYVISGGQIVTSGSSDHVLNQDQILESYLGVKA